eukprot:INCI2853.1.p1 GENE.INCI2853.1~~INCI2853.1.p1  ORF type:complete len:350 (-),score=60.45 INCI2853.1:156-1205(-)
MGGDNGGKKLEPVRDKHRKKGWVSRAVRAHNEHPDAITRFLRANAPHLSFAVVLGAAVLHITGEKTLNLAYAVEQDDGSIKYGKGIDDAYFMFVSVFFLTLLRSLFLELVAEPLGHAMKVQSKDMVKFNDQAWQGTYYTVAWCSGFSIMWRHSDTWGFQIDQLTTSFPDKLVDGDMKLYYMLQCSFWLHAIIIHTVEMWRKDFLLYYIHHVITSSLCIGSYFKSATRIGFFILVEQDFADIFLPLAKVFNYANWKESANIVFALFAVAWIPTRHYLYNMFLLEIWNMELEGEAGEYLSNAEWTGFFIFLVALQLLLCVWLKDLLVAIYKVLQPTANGIEDHRSSGEEDD